MSSVKPRKKVGLALSGGIARAPVHVGVLSVLEREGIPIDYIAGTSAGAIVGGAYCAGLEIPEMQALSSYLGWRQVAAINFSRHGLITFRKIETVLESLVGELDLRDLSIPFTAVATDMERGQSVYLRRGPLARAVHASCAVPGLVTPVEIDGRVLCDGGVVANLPVAAVKQMGAEYVIAVDLFIHAYWPRLGLIGSLAAALELLIRHAGGGASAADCLVEPEISGHNYFNFSRRKSEQYMRLGERAAEQMIPRIKADLGLCEMRETDFTAVLHTS